jgi:hypothetical protein
MIAPRIAKPTVGVVDEYCERYRDLFVEVRSFEAFKHLHVGMISEAKRKSLPAIAKVRGHVVFETEKLLPGLNHDHPIRCKERMYLIRIVVCAVANHATRVEVAKNVCT